MIIGWQNSPKQGGDNNLASILAAQAGVPNPTLNNQAGSDPTQLSLQGTGNPGNDPYNPPGSPNQYHWQGGQANPNGTQAANGRQTGGRFVDQTYTHDATGRELSAAEQAGWHQYDVNRANAALSEQEGRLAWRASLAKTDGGTGVDAPVYDPDTDTFSYVDKDGKWTHGVSQKDIYSKLTDDVKKQYPEWYFGEYAQTQRDARRSNLDAAAYSNQSFARMGQQSTRYAATSF